MSEYWKSTPKYWCKFCKTYVRDTKFEKQQHESTPRHQGNIQRSLRTLHKDNEREAREKQRAKDEVARLNGIVSGTAATKPSQSLNATSSSASAPPTAATGLEERKRQMKQLADMGVAIPSEYRGDLAIAGDWQTVEKPASKKESIKVEAQSHGVRKRKHEEADEDIDSSDRTTQKGWGSSIRSYPGAEVQNDDIEALLNGTIENKLSREVKEEEDASDQDIKPSISTLEDATETLGKESSPSQEPVVFKKRKGKISKPS